jgi:Na+-transporting NADH:ubiquinone oxidoreductase subunit NqrF
MGAAYTTDLLYDACFCTLAQKFPNFHYHPVISREVQSEGAPGSYIHHYLDRQIKLHEDMLHNDRTLMYICGTAGMQLGVFQLLARLELGDPFLKIKDEIADVAPEEWDIKHIKRYVRPTHRCMLEVY